VFLHAVFSLFYLLVEHLIKKLSKEIGLLQKIELIILESDWIFLDEQNLFIK
jgi:hypothetical protein